LFQLTQHFSVSLAFTLSACEEFGELSSRCDACLMVFFSYQNGEYCLVLLAVWSFDLQTRLWTKIAAKGEIPVHHMLRTGTI
jgi:hypothetical protein